MNCEFKAGRGYHNAEKASSYGFASSAITEPFDSHRTSSTVAMHIWESLMHIAVAVEGAREGVGGS